MQTEEKLEGISVEEEKKIKKISTIIMIVILVIGLLVTTDILLVSKAGVGPFLAIRTKVYDDGGTKEYYGLGYKVIKYNQKIGRRDTVLGTWSLKYDTNPIDFTLEDLALSIVNDNNNHLTDFIRLTGTINNINKNSKTITLRYKDENNGKYELTVKANVISHKFNYNKNDTISLIGVVSNYEKKSQTLIISNAFAEKLTK